MTEHITSNSGFTSEFKKYLIYFKSYFILRAKKVLVK